MRKMFAALVAFTAAAAFAGGIQVSPSQVTMRVGQVSILTAIDAPGFGVGFPYNVTFFSDAPEVAVISGFASGSGYLNPDPFPHNGEVNVTAIAPGVAHVRARNCCGDLATVVVLPEPVVAIQPDSVTVVNGKQVMLMASVINAPTYVTFEWFKGQTGDQSKPLQTSGSPILIFTPDATTKAVWVRATSGIWQNSAETKVIVTPVRRRAVR